ncbi:hypothetical protein JTE90_008410 [Oedothorax gibbosus]|uniref:Uncharacterized protein n=1 Tax=Oedothorax gibbosus TaxID=931172 RepID=A0AAV6V598_9ARAC|nr:hypothetical protein JTE90_008410 [Oedothorax gibbosus]
MKRLISPLQSVLRTLIRIPPELYQLSYEQFQFQEGVGERYARSHGRNIIRNIPGFSKHIKEMNRGHELIRTERRKNENTRVLLPVLDARRGQ